jgi:hypothetical protein
MPLRVGDRASAGGGASEGRVSLLPMDQQLMVVLSNGKLEVVIEGFIGGDGRLQLSVSSVSTHLTLSFVGCVSSSPPHTCLVGCTPRMQLLVVSTAFIKTASESSIALTLIGNPRFVWVLCTKGSEHADSRVAGSTPSKR